MNYSTAIFIELYRKNLQIVLKYLPTPTKFLVSITEKMMYKILENQIDTMHTFSVISNFRVERLMAGTLDSASGVRYTEKKIPSTTHL